MPDADGYPTKEELARIGDWPFTDPLGWFAFTKGCWWAADWGWAEHDGSNDFGFARGGKRIFHLSAGGWSGNEAIIAAMREHGGLWSLTWYAHRRGGHFEFEVQLTPGAGDRSA